MLSTLLLLMLPNYLYLPPVPRNSIAECYRQSRNLENFVGRFGQVVLDSQERNGGRLTWDESNTIIGEARNKIIPYLEQMKISGEAGRGEDCARLNDEGQYVVIEEVIRPVFGDYRNCVRNSAGYC